MANEKRLIDANELKNLVCDRCNEEYSDEPCEPCDCSFIYAIDKAPTVDAAPVVHGRWVCLEAEIGYFACSECDHRILRAKCNYCPNCGAKMDGDGNG